MKIIMSTQSIFINVIKRWQFLMLRKKWIEFQNFIIFSLNIQIWTSFRKEIRIMKFWQLITFPALLISDDWIVLIVCCFVDFSSSLADFESGSLVNFISCSSEGWVESPGSSEGSRDLCSISSSFSLAELSSELFSELISELDSELPSSYSSSYS